MAWGGRGDIMTEEYLHRISVQGRRMVWGGRGDIMGQALELMMTN
jgi:hypothetical protein